MLREQQLQVLALVLVPQMVVQRAPLLALGVL
jgi:hypothetical protein